MMTEHPTEVRGHVRIQSDEDWTSAKWPNEKQDGVRHLKYQSGSLTAAS